MKSSAQISTKVLSATLFISLISASQSEAACGGSKNNPFSAIEEACAAAADGVKADDKEKETREIVAVRHTKQQEAPVVGVEILYSEGKYNFRSTSTGGLISKCHILASAHPIPHPLKVTGEENRRGAAIATMVQPKSNLLGASVSVINQHVKVRVALASDTNEVRFLGGKVAGIGRSERPDFLEVADDLMVIRLDRNVDDIVPIELHTKKFKRAISFKYKALTYAGNEGGFKVKQENCSATLTDPVSSLNEPTMVKYNCLNTPGDSGGLLISTSAEQGQAGQPGAWAGILIGENPSNLSEGGGVLISKKLALIEKWMQENPCSK